MMTHRECAASVAATATCLLQGHDADRMMVFWEAQACAMFF